MVTSIAHVLCSSLTWLLEVSNVNLILSGPTSESERYVLEDGWFRGRDSYLAVIFVV
ncbi:hypothetical protein JANAI62_20020 [Jannaschia pagri]|uniref:Uncharacterized protein n=1 Tax=Jannaschia pagri TaxID=2829797 RepID=A0ABQ4NLT7_9RHOB|nr:MULTISPECIES: hypothetical protein [unclassified Jannaschia]GIT91545.1 hypothetical protein JANAI61_20030 [Jannaschia sp. AI_61]GIT95379.1 hypothetical protein JANAI62_20020 [Jannaschia sp. AI_62]